MHARRIPRTKPNAIRPGLRAYFVATMAFIVAFAPVLGTMHRALVRHQVCEHGDLIELPNEELRAVASSVVEEGGHSATVAQAAGSAEHRHDHCSLSALGRTASAPPREPAQVTRIAESTVIVSIASDRWRALSILSLAPKTSPPVARAPRTA